MEARSSLPASVLMACTLLLIALWIPGTFFYAPFADTAIYALLGESLWQHGTYTLFDVPHAKYLPLHAFLSYPLTQLFGYHIGMQMLSLGMGIACLFLTYRVVTRFFSRGIALWTVPLLTLHHGFVLATMQGGADLTFTALFLATLLVYDTASKRPRFYVGTGFLLGLLCLTRYNGFPVLLFLLLHAVFVRRAYRFPSFALGVLLGAGLIGAWFVRNVLVFGHAFATDYTAEQTGRSAGAFAQLVQNLLYYLHPLHNILPLFFILALFGIVRHGRAKGFLLLAIISVLALSALWWVHAVRFLLPAVPLLLAFGVTGAADIIAWMPRFRTAVISLFFLIALCTHGVMLCLYSEGACNAFVDRHIGIVPPYLGLTPEGLYAWTLARRYINAHAETGATVLADEPQDAAVWQGTMFRSDLTVMVPPPRSCPAYAIVQGQTRTGSVLYEADVLPRTQVLAVPCP